MIDTVPPPGHHGHVRPSPGSRRQEREGTAELGVTGGVTVEDLRRRRALALEDIPRGASLFAGTVDLPGFGEPRP